MDSLKRAGIAVPGMAVPRWKAEGGSILDVIRDHHGGETRYPLVRPSPSAAATAALRKDIRQVAPSFAAFVDQLGQAQEGHCGVFIAQLGLDALDTNSRAMLAYAVGICMGEPTATDMHRVIWDVKPRHTEAGYFSTFSETDQEAAYHTDTQYYPEPEDAFFLYTIEAARCGGGWSQACDARALRADLERSAAWVSDVLANKPLPFRVPTAFMTTNEPGAVQATIAPVFGDRPFVRYRRDTLEDGLRHFPEYGDADVYRALDEFEERLSTCRYAAEFFMPRDSLLLIDNHRALHARTRFYDQARHLLRIRIHKESVRSAAPYELVTRTQARRAMAAAMEPFQATDHAEKLTYL